MVLWMALSFLLPAALVVFIVSFRCLMSYAYQTDSQGITAPSHRKARRRRNNISSEGRPRGRSRSHFYYEGHRHLWSVRQWRVHHRPIKLSSAVADDDPPSAPNWFMKLFRRGWAWLPSDWIVCVVRWMFFAIGSLSGWIFYIIRFIFFVACIAIQELWECPVTISLLLVLNYYPSQFYVATVDSVRVIKLAYAAAAVMCGATMLDFSTVPRDVIKSSAMLRAMYH